MMLWKDNHYFLKCDNTYMEEKLSGIEADYKKRMEKAKAALELFQTKYAEVRPEADPS